MTNNATTNTLETRYTRCRELLEANNQPHLLRWWKQLDPPSQAQLLDDIESIPWSDLRPIIETHVRKKSNTTRRYTLSLPPFGRPFQNPKTPTDTMKPHPSDAS